MTAARHCSVANCSRAYSCRGFCASHYETARRNGTITVHKAAQHGTLYRYQRGCRCDECRAAATAYDREWRVKNPDAYKRKSRRQHMQKMYGLTPDDYEAMLAAQGGVCAICGVRPGVRESKLRANLCVDHCHTTGRIRGILCGPCNRAIGMLGDDPAVIAAAHQYLLAHSAERVV